MDNHFRADLHCHTTCSDGTVSPRLLIELAHEKQLQGLSITDHDTIQAYEEALPAAKEKDILLISGVEFSASHRDTTVHILAYSFSLLSPLIQSFCQKHHVRRTERNRAILERLASQGIPLTLEDLHLELSLPSHHPVGRPHIAYVLMKKGYVSSLQQAFQTYIGERKPCYVRGDTFSVEETLDLIHRAQGLAVIAHPHLIAKERVLKELLAMNFDGIEGYYGRFPQTQQERWLKIGASKGWLITGGSDFHGDIKPMIPLGCSWIGQETFMALYQHFQSNQS